MRTKTFTRLAAAAGVSLGLAVAADAAHADTHWTVNGVFQDQGQLNGTFDIDQYGYITAANLTVTGGAFPGFTYTLANSYVSSGTVPGPDYDTYVAPYFIDLQPDYQSDLHLEFLHGLITPLANNLLLGGYQGPSSECRYSYSCFAQDGAVRYFDGGSASAASGAPEPAAWSLMLLGFGGLGAALRAARRRTAVAAA